MTPMPKRRRKNPGLEKLYDLLADAARHRVPHAPMRKRAAPITHAATALMLDPASARRFADAAVAGAPALADLRDRISKLEDCPRNPQSLRKLNRAH